MNKCSRGVRSAEISTQPRRALIAPEEPEHRSRIPAIMTATTIASALLVGVTFLVFGPSTTTSETTPVVSTAPAEPTSSVPESPPVTDSTPEAPTISPPPSGNAPLPTPNPPTDTPAASDPATTAGPPAGEGEPTATATPTGLIELNDTSFAAADGWLVYGDDLVEGDRRVVRLSEPTSDARLQALTLLQDPDLSASCEALMAAQKGQFAVTSEQLARPVSVVAAEGTGVSCGFSGVRSSDGVVNTVSFTLLRRATDSHVLMLRTTIPDAVGVGDQPRRDLTRMTCAASSGFGVSLPLC